MEFLTARESLLISHPEKSKTFRIRLTVQVLEEAILRRPGYYCIISAVIDRSGVALLK